MYVSLAETVFSNFHLAGDSRKLGNFTLEPSYLAFLADVKDPAGNGSILPARGSCHVGANISMRENEFTASARDSRGQPSSSAQMATPGSPSARHFPFANGSLGWERARAEVPVQAQMTAGSPGLARFWVPELRGPARPSLGSVGGGELFDRITDEKCHLTELDVVLFIRQICAGVHYLHQHYILHLDLKVRPRGGGQGARSRSGPARQAAGGPRVSESVPAALLSSRAQPLGRQPWPPLPALCHLVVRAVTSPF